MIIPNAYIRDATANFIVVVVVESMIVVVEADNDTVAAAAAALALAASIAAPTKITFINRTEITACSRSGFQFPSLS